MTWKVDPAPKPQTKLVNENCHEELWFSDAGHLEFKTSTPGYSDDGDTLCPKAQVRTLAEWLADHLDCTLVPKESNT